jgi:hypothetical protein
VPFEETKNGNDSIARSSLESVSPLFSVFFLDLSFFDPVNVSSPCPLLFVEMELASHGATEVQERKALVKPLGEGRHPGALGQERPCRAWVRISIRR